MSKPSSNGDEIPEADPSILQRILGKAKSEQAKQEGFWRSHQARERSRQARVRAQKKRKDKGGAYSGDDGSPQYGAALGAAGR